MMRQIDQTLLYLENGLMQYDIYIYEYEYTVPFLKK